MAKKQLLQILGSSRPTCLGHTKENFLFQKGQLLHIIASAIFCVDMSLISICYLRWLIFTAQKIQCSAEKFQFSAEKFQFNAKKIQFSAKNKSI